MSTKEFIIDVEEFVATSDETLFSPSAQKRLEARLKKMSGIELVLAGEQSPRRKITRVASKSETWKKFPNKWSLILLSIDKIHLELQSLRAVDADENDDIEEENIDENATEDLDADNEREVDVKELAQKLKGRFTYIDKLSITFNNSVENNTVIAKNYKSTITIYQRIVSFWERVKIAIRKTSEFLGIDGFFVILARLMDRFLILDILVRIVGTVIVLLILCLVVIILPITRFLANPIQRTLNFFAKLLGIRPPTDDDPDS